MIQYGVLYDSFVFEILGQLLLTNYKSRDEAFKAIGADGWHLVTVVRYEETFISSDDITTIYGHYEYYFEREVETE